MTHPGEEASSSCPSRVLVICADPTTGDESGRDTLDLVASLASQCRHTELSVHLTEVPRYPQLPGAWRSAGIDVTVGPPDRRLAARAFSHVILTREGALSRARYWVDSTQPDALRVVYSRAHPPLDRPDEPSAAHVRSIVLGQEEELAGWADAVWCRDRVGVEMTTARAPGPAVHLVPQAIEAATPGADRSTRQGVVVAELDGFDVSSGSEEGAVRALSAVVHPLLRRHPGLGCTLVTSAPTAALRRAADAVGARIRPPTDLADAVSGALVLIAAHPFGSGQRAVIAESLRWRTPFVATRPALGGLEFAAIDGDDRLVAEADRLLRDEAWWRLQSDSQADIREACYSGARRQAELASALAAAGIASGRPLPGPRMIFPRPGSTWNPWPKPEQRLRPYLAEPAATAEPEAGAEPAATAEPEAGAEPAAAPGRTDEAVRDGQYRRWVDRHGPTPAALDGIRRQLEEIKEPPLVSVVMPVYNTEPELLCQAIDSVRKQIYGGWHLCLADDGSDRPDTLAVLDELVADDRIDLIRLGGRSGIAATTNAAIGLARGDYVAFLDHDDILKPHALAQVVRWITSDPDLDLLYSDEDILGADGLLRDVHLKPDWSPDHLMSQNYLCHLTVIRRRLLEEIGGLRPAYDGSQDFDLVLRASERTDRIGHIPEPLYSWRAAPGSVAADLGAKPYAIDAGAAAVADAMARRGYRPNVETVDRAGRYRARWPLPGPARVSIVIPTRDRLDLLRRCIESIQDLSTYDNYEIVIVDNGSVEADTLGWLAAVSWPVLRYPYEFNYARMMNFAAATLETDALLFVNNDTVLTTPSWIEALLEQAVRPQVGAVGGRLRFPAGRPQHEGISIGTWGDWANNIDHRGYFARGEMVRNTSAVTGACCMIRPGVYRAVGGADERLRVAYNDVDLCLRIRRAGWEIVYTPYAELVHAEGSTRGDYQHHDDAPLFRDRWDPRAVLDPYYSPVFSDSRPFEIES